MTELLNYDFVDEDLKDIDKLVSILLNKLNIEEENEEEKGKESSKSVENENISKKEGNKLEIVKSSKLRDLLNSIDNENKFSENDINNINEDKKTKVKNKKTINVFNFNIKKAKEFLKMNENKKQIDLHGFTLVQSMYIVEKKLISLKDKKNEDNLKEITLNIITGVGNNSPGHKPILYPNLTKQSASPIIPIPILR